MAFLNYKMSEYSKSADFFKEIAGEEPSNVLAHYYAGISLYQLKRYKEAVGYFTHSAENSPTISTNGHYYAGICYQKMGNIEKAAEKFAYVKEHADSELLRENAEKWLLSLKKQKVLKPYSIYLKAGRRYDDNVRLAPLDQSWDTNQGADKGDYVTVGYLSGSYRFLNKGGFEAGAGYSHYQAWYDELDMYDLTGSILTLYTRYRFHPLTFGFAYLPTYYWADSESYLRRHQVKPEVVWKISEKFVARFSYSFYDDTYFQNSGRDGNTHEIFADAFYALPGGNGSLFGSFGYEKNEASASDYDYGQFRIKSGISLDLPWNLNFRLTGKYYDKKYDNPDSYYQVKRDEGKYAGSVSLSRKLFYDWLSVSAEFDYTKNDSNIPVYDYEKNTATLSVTVKQ